MEKIIEKGILYNFYGELLTEHQRRIYEDVVYQDLSISEIAKEQGVSRQSIFDLIKRCDKILEDYEDKLRLVYKFYSIKKKVSDIQSVTNQSEVKKLVDEILEEL